MASGRLAWNVPARRCNLSIVQERSYTNSCIDISNPSYALQAPTNGFVTWLFQRSPRHFNVEKCKSCFFFTSKKKVPCLSARWTSFSCGSIFLAKLEAHSGTALNDTVINDYSLLNAMRFLQALFLAFNHCHVFLRLDMSAEETI